MNCLHNIANGLHPVINPGSSSEVLKQEKIKKANGLLALGVIIAITAVALAVLGIAITATLSPLGLALIASSAPIFWMGHTISKLATNYKEIINNNVNYWDKSTQKPMHQKITSDLLKGLICKCCFEDSKPQATTQRAVVSQDPLDSSPDKVNQIPKPMNQSQAELYDLLQRDSKKKEKQEEVAAEEIKKLINKTELAIANLSQSKSINIEEYKQKIEECKKQIQPLEEMPSRNQIQDYKLKNLKSNIESYENSIAQEKARRKINVKSGTEFHISSLRLKAMSITMELTKEEKQRVLSPYFAKYPELKNI